MVFGGETYAFADFFDAPFSQSFDTLEVIEKCTAYYFERLKTPLQDADKISYYSEKEIDRFMCYDFFKFLNGTKTCVVFRKKIGLAQQWP